MRFHVQQAVRAVILLGFAGLIVYLHYSEDIVKLINPKYETLSKIGAIIFLLLFTVQLRRVLAPKGADQDHPHDHGSHRHDHGYSPVDAKKLLSYSIVVLPLVTSILIPLSTLDASIAAKKGTMLALTSNAENQEKKRERENDAGVAISETEQAVPKEENIEEEGTIPDTSGSDGTPDPNLYSNSVSEETYQQLMDELEVRESIQMPDQVYAAYYDEISSNVEQYIGKEITVNGFVYKEEGFSANQLVVGRFLITHCVADSSIIGFLAEFDDAESIAEDTWLEATGIIQLETYNGHELPVLKITKWQKIKEPEQPYLYPLNIKYS